jgi:hypothetical protein
LPGRPSSYFCSVDTFAQQGSNRACKRNRGSDHRHKWGRGSQIFIQQKKFNLRRYPEETMPPQPRSLLPANAFAAAQAAVPVEAGEMMLTMRVRLLELCNHTI